MMSLCSSSSMQMPTPPMTQAEYQWERHHRCSEWQCLLSDEVLQHESNDWTLFPSEEAPLAEPTPRPGPRSENSKTFKPPQGRAQKESKARKQQRLTGVKEKRTSKAHRPRATKEQSSWSATKPNVTLLTSSSIKDECFDVPTCRVAGFTDVPRTSESTRTFERFPTPPLEDMGEMFAPIEALGEDLRWYRSVQGSHGGVDQLLRH